MSRMTTGIFRLSQSQFLHDLSPNGFVNGVAQRVPLVEQQLLYLPEHPSSPMAASRICVVHFVQLYVFTF